MKQQVELMRSWFELQHFLNVQSSKWFSSGTYELQCFTAIVVLYKTDLELYAFLGVTVWGCESECLYVGVLLFSNDGLHGLLHLGMDLPPSPKLFYTKLYGYVAHSTWCCETAE